MWNIVFTELYVLLYTFISINCFSLLVLTGLCTMMSVVFLPALSFFLVRLPFPLLPSSQPPFLFFGSHWGRFSLLFCIKYQKREHWEQQRYSLSTVIFFFFLVSPRLLRVQCSLCIEISLEDQPWRKSPALLGFQWWAGGIPSTEWFWEIASYSWKALKKSLLWMCKLHFGKGIFIHLGHIRSRFQK